MDPRATELMACMDTPPMDTSDVARVTTLLRSIREQGMSRADHQTWLDLSEQVRLWAERAALGADTASVLTELADLMAARLDDAERAATLYVRSLTLRPVDFSVSERATFHLTKLHARDALAHVLQEHARILEAMPWVEEKYRAAAWAKLSEVARAPSAPLTAPSTAGARGDDTPTALHPRTWSQVAHAPAREAVPPASWVSRTVPPQVAPSSRVAPLYAGLALLVCALSIVLASRQPPPRHHVSATARSEPSRTTKGHPAVGPGAASALPASRPLQTTESHDQPPQLPPSPPHASLSRSSVRVHDDLISRRDVIKAVRPILPELARCYANLFATQLATTVELEVTWVVRPSGRTERVLVRSSLLPDDERRICAGEALGKPRFPEGEREVIRVRGLLVLEP